MLSLPLTARVYRVSTESHAEEAAVIGEVLHIGIDARLERGEGALQAEIIRFQMAFETIR
jgi:hypothetical protein